MQLHQKATPTQRTQLFSCEYCESFQNTYFEEYLRTTASVMALDEGIYKTWAALLTSVVGIILKPSVFLLSIAFKSLNFSFGVVKQVSLPQGKWKMVDWRILSDTNDQKKKMALLILFSLVIIKNVINMSDIGRLFPWFIFHKIYIIFIKCFRQFPTLTNYFIPF